MIYGSNCGQQNDDAARVCLHCGAKFTGQASSTPFTTAERESSGAQQTESPWAGQQAGQQPPQYIQERPRGVGLASVGTKREPLMVLLFSILTCGIYALW